MSAADLHDRAAELRGGQSRAEEHVVRGIVADIESDVAVYRDADRPQVPPDHMRDLLPLMGWLMYEASWWALQRIAPAYEGLDDDAGKRSREAAELVRRVADAARELPWPEFAPRALGAIRAQALAASKRDTPAGYDQAWLLHEDARAKHRLFVESHAGEQARQRYIVDLDEVLLQLALAETGTACRTAERVIGRWSEGVAERTWDDADQDRWTQRMFRELHLGLSTGEEALQLADHIEREYGLVDEVTADRFALRTSFQNPGIMTARAALLMLALTPAMEKLGRRPLDGHESWASMRADLLKRFTNAYRRIERPVLDENDRPKQPNPNHLRSMVQLRLNLALLAPGHSLPAEQAFEPCLALDPLDDAAVEEMSAWLAEKVDGRQRGDANVIGSATMPAFVVSVERCRAAFGAHGGYREWRRRWWVLDRHAAERDRRRRVEDVVGPIGADD